MKASKGEKIFYVINTIFFLLIALIILVPLLTVLKKSLDANPTGGHPLSLIPNEWSLVYYNMIFKNRGIYGPFLNSIYVTVIGTALALIIQSMAAFTVSRRNLPGKKFITYFMIVTMVFSGGIMPMYLVMRELHLLNSLWAVILPSCVSAWNIVLIRNYYWSIPESLGESARIDGAGEFKVYFRITLPLSGPVIATVGLFTAISYWTSYYYASIFINSPEKFTFPVKFREMILQQEDMSNTLQQAGSMSSYLTSEGISAAIIIISIIPILLVYPYLQRFFMKGIMVGAVKG